MKALFLPVGVAAIVCAPAFAAVTVTSPTSGASVTSPFTLSATASPCSSQPIAAIGYSIDNSTNTTFVYSASILAQVTAPFGSHILHVKSWGNRGAACDTDVSLNIVTGAPVVSGPTIPSNAIAIKAIQNLTTWQAAFDAGTGGSASSSGIMSLVRWPALSGSARQFITTYSNYGGERYSAKIGTDTTASNFVFDTRLYLASPVTDVANIEMDINQVMANGQTVIFGFQCDGWSRSWDYTVNLGTPTSPNDQWLHSNQSCNPQAWSTNTWHHIQVSYARDNSGNVTYKSVWFDGVEHDFNATVNSAFALGWAPTLLVNFQVDGMTALPGTATIYADNMTVYRW